MSILGDLGGPHLDVPSTDDPMQLSPDLDRHAPDDDDIDIDFDIDNDISPGDRVEEDDTMEEQLDDANYQQAYDNHPGIFAKDHEMIDEGEPDESRQERDSLVDEDLEDVDSPIAGENPEEVQELSYDELQTKEAIQLEGLSTDLEGSARSNGIEIQDYGDQADQNSAGINDVIHDHKSGAGDQINGSRIGQKSSFQAPADPDKQEESPAEGTHESLQDETSKSTVNTQDTQLTDKIRSTGAVLSARTDEIVDSQQQRSTKNAEAHEIPPTAHSLHPIIVVYQGNEMSLFPPIDQDTEQAQTYFLDNESYADETLSNLFDHFRSVLADSIRDAEELEIKIADLGLNVNESSADQTPITLSHILDIFVQLNHNDGVEDPDPLYIELCTNCKVSNRVDYLTAAVADGKGLSQIELPRESEVLNGGEDYAEDDEITAEDEADNANNTSNTEPEETASINKEQPPLDETEHSRDEEGRSPNVPKDVALLQGSQSAPTHTERSGPSELNYEQTAVDEDDDIIDYSDEEVVPDRAAGSSRIQGDHLKSDVSPEVEYDVDNIIDHDAVEDRVPAINSKNTLSDPPLHLHATNVDADKPIQVPNGKLDDGPLSRTHLEDFEDLDDYDETPSDNLKEEGSLIGDYNNESVDDEYPASVAANGLRATNQKPTESIGNISRRSGADPLPTSEVGFEEDLGYVSDDKTTLDSSKVSKQSAGAVRDPRLDLPKTNGKDLDASLDESTEDFDPVSKSNIQEPLIDDVDQINYDDDDEITIPDSVDPKSSSSPKSTKRSRESQDSEDALNGTLSEAKRVRST